MSAIYRRFIQPKFVGQKPKHHQSKFNRNLLLSTILAGGLGLAQQLHAESLTATLVDTYLNNPTLQAERSNFRVAAEKLGQAQAQLFPSASVSGNTTWQKQETGPLSVNSKPNSVTATVTQPLFKAAVFWGLGAAYDSVKAARHRLNLAESNQLLAAATAYFNLVQDRATLDLQTNNLRVLTAQLESVQIQFEIGQLTVTEVAQAQAAKENANAAKLSAEANLAIDRAVYMQVVGRMPVETGFDDDAIPEKFLPNSIDAVTEQATRQNPAVLAAQSDENAARAGVGVAAGALLPTVNLVGSYGIQHQANLAMPGFPMQTTKNTQVMIQMSMPIYDSGSSYAGIRQARQVANQQRLLADAALRTAVQNAMTAYQQLTSSRAQLVSLEAAIKANNIALQGTKRKQELGNMTVLDVLNAEQTLLNSKVQRVQTRRNALVAAYQLMLATGHLYAREIELPVELYDADYYRDKASWKLFGFGDAVPDATHD